MTLTFLSVTVTFLLYPVDYHVAVEKKKIRQHELVQCISDLGSALYNK